MSADNPSNRNHRNSISADEVKRAAAGRWPEILTAVAGIPAELLDGHGHPCPKCGGTDRFKAFRDVEQTGGVMCRQCFGTHNRDGLAAVQWMLECTFPEAVAYVAEYLSLVPTGSAGSNSDLDIVATVARAKRMPLDAFRQFGAEAAKRGKKTVARVPVYDERGEIHSHFDLSPDAKGWFKRGKGNSGLFFAGRLPEPGETWLLVEGVKDAAALVGLGFNAAGLPRNELAAKYARLFRGCDIVIVPDLDTPGIRGAETTAACLKGVALSVRIARLPGEITRSGGDDVRDVLNRCGEDPVRTAILESVTWEPSETRPDDERPEVVVTMDEAAVAERVIECLASLGWDSPWLTPDVAEQCRLYQRGDVLVQVLHDSEPGKSGITMPESPPRIRPVPKALLRERITQACRLVVEKKTSDGAVIEAKRPPDWLVNSIHQRGHYGAVRKLAGITRTPTLRPDGTLLQFPGYDQQTGLLYLPDRKFPQVLENPTWDDAHHAARELLDVVADFPFAGDADRSIWLAAVLSLLARPAFDGPCPLFAFDANTRGAGKTLLVDVAGIIATGSAIARMAWPGADKEVRKVITAIALEACPVVLFDNVAAALGGDAIDAALTATTWQDRILSESRTTGLLPLTTVWMATGNNLQLKADTARRVLMSRLESLEEHPEDRTNIRRKDLKAYARAERPKLAVAGLTILRAYFAAGCPTMDIPPWGSFEAWSNLVRHALTWAGCADPWETRESMRDADRSSELLGLIHAGIEEVDNGGNGITASEIAKRLSKSEADESDPFPALRSAITELCGLKYDSRSIGYRLREYRGRVRAGKRLASRKGHAGVQRWFIESVA